EYCDDGGRRCGDAAGAERNGHQVLDHLCEQSPLRDAVLTRLRGGEPDVTSRVLPRAEWDRLKGTEAETVCPLLPESAQVLVVEDGTAIAGCWVLLPVLHVECLYVAPEHRKKPSVARRLLAGMRRLVRESGGRGVW